MQDGGSQRQPLTSHSRTLSERTQQQALPTRLQQTQHDVRACLQGRAERLQQHEQVPPADQQALWQMLPDQEQVHACPTQPQHLRHHTAPEALAQRRCAWPQHLHHAQRRRELQPEGRTSALQRAQQHAWQPVACGEHALQLTVLRDCELAVPHAAGHVVHVLQ